MRIVISSGHGKYISGAVGIINEHQEAVRVVNQVAIYLGNSGVGVVTFEDTTSRDQSTNLKTIVDFHNKQTRDLDVSVHFNSYQNTSKPMGTECLYVTQATLSKNVAEAISIAGGLVNRGPKKRTDLYFLNNTNKPAILIEVCFVDSSADVTAYQGRFDGICAAIAETISGQAITPPAPTPPSEGKPTIGKGDDDAEFVQPYVSQAQTSLNQQNNAGLAVDGDFGSLTDTATRNYQRSRGLGVDGWIGPQTWAALDSSKPPLPAPPGALTAKQQSDICAIARGSNIAGYSWKNRGKAPSGWTQGMALAFAQDYLRLQAGHPALTKITQARRNSDKDALNVYNNNYRQLGTSNERPGIEVLVNLYALMLGHGMRESSGKHCEGRDRSATNVSSDTAEAGAFQTSYNAHGASDPEFDEVMNEFVGEHGYCYLEAFAQNVNCSESDWQCYGSGRGFQFQQLCKNCPMFSCESAALTLRMLCNHYGPIVRREVELKDEALDLFAQVRDYMDGWGVPTTV